MCQAWWYGVADGGRWRREATAGLHARRGAVGMARGRAGARTHTAARRPIAARAARTHAPANHAKNLVF